MQSFSRRKCGTSPTTEHIADTVLLSSLVGSLLRIRRFVLHRIREAVVSRKNKVVIASLLHGGEPLHLELGAGPRKMPGWATIGLNRTSDIEMDLTTPLPFPDDCAAVIYSSHLLEHLEYPGLLQLLCECHRILQPAGTIKIAVPDAAIYLKAYDSAEFDVEYYCRYKPALYYNSRIDYVNYIAYMAGEHRYMFDEEALLAILANAGFRDVRRREFDPRLDLEERRYESIYAEGTK